MRGTWTLAVRRWMRYCAPIQPSQSTHAHLAIPRQAFEDHIAKKRRVRELFKRVAAAISNLLRNKSMMSALRSGLKSAYSNAKAELLESMKMIAHTR